MLKNWRRQNGDDAPYEIQEYFSDLSLMDDPDIQIIHLPPEGTDGVDWRLPLNPPPRPRVGQLYVTSEEKLASCADEDEPEEVLKLMRSWSSTPYSEDRVTVSPPVPRKRKCDLVLERVEGEHALPTHPPLHQKLSSSVQKDPNHDLESVNEKQALHTYPRHQEFDWNDAKPDLERVRGKHALPTHPPHPLQFDCFDEGEDTDDAVRETQSLATISDPNLAGPRFETPSHTASDTHQHQHHKVRSTLIKNMQCSIAWKMRDHLHKRSFPEKCRLGDDDKKLSQSKLKVARSKLKNSFSKFEWCVRDILKSDKSLDTVIPLSAAPATSRLSEATHYDITTPSVTSFRNVRQRIVRQTCSGSEVEQKGRLSSTRISLRNASAIFRWKVLDTCNSLKKLVSKTKAPKSNRVEPM